MAIQWHPWVHERWLNESLYFWRLAFSPMYQRKKVHEELDAYLKQLSVLSCVAYELLGVHDLMLRVWLPQGVSPSNFQAGLRAALRPIDLTMSDYFAVSEVYAHWLWPATDGRLDMPAAELLDAGLPAGKDLSRIDVGSEGYDDLYRDKLVRPLDSKEGVKFFTVITAPGIPSDVARDRFHARMSEQLHKSGVDEPSLYLGHGFGSGSMIMMGRVPFGQFYNLGEKLAIPITDFTEVLGVRPYTFPTSTNDFFVYSEQMPEVADEEAARRKRVAPKFPVLPKAFEEGESQTREIKASAFLNVERLVKGDLRATLSTSVADHGFLRAMVAFLNSDGGHVIVGAVECRKFLPSELWQGFGEVTRHGDYLVVGLDHELDGKSLDEFDQKMNNVIASHITPAPSGAYRIHYETLDGREMMIIEVEEGKQWYYLNDDDFLIRRGAQSQSLGRSETERYQQTRPRRQKGE